MNFRIGKIKCYTSPSPRYELPIQVGGFSTDSENKFCDDHHQMKYLSLPKNLRNLHLDLNEGYSKYVGDYNDEEDPYNKLLRWIISHKEEIRHFFVQNQEDASKGEVHFICHRTDLLAISSTLYEKFSDWSIYATKFRSVIYLCNVDTERKRQRESTMTDNDRRMISWGYKFEQYITSDTPYTKPNTSLPVNVNEKYFVVMKGKLQQHGILFSGETDAVDPKYLLEDDRTTYSKSMDRFVEMKTNRMLDSDRIKNTFRRKLLKCYLQSFITGIPRLICGFRDDGGIVREIETFNVYELPGMADGLWSPDACLNFLSSFLNFVKQRVVRDEVVYKFYWNPGSFDITCEELTAHQFLPDWYMREMSAL